jgi:hypothetical protein
LHHHANKVYSGTGNSIERGQVEAMNFIVLRQSPDWLTFDLDATRSFCTRVGVPENMIIDFVKQWDSTLNLDYRKFRHAMKQITLSSIAACSDSALVSSADLRALNERDLIYFTDDDDWVMPDLFAVLHSYDIQDGFLWGSIRVGPGPAVVEKRAFSNTIYTNNYCVTGRVVRRLGLDAVFEHSGANNNFNSGLFAPTKIERYLSCANKHPCCTVNIKHDPDFDLCVGMARFLEQLSNPTFDEETSWARPYISELKRTVSAALQPNS